MPPSRSRLMESMVRSWGMSATHCLNKRSISVVMSYYCNIPQAAGVQGGTWCGGGGGGRGGEGTCDTSGAWEKRRGLAVVTSVERGRRNGFSGGGEERAKQRTRHSFFRQKRHELSGVLVNRC